ncbi:unnamed protein product [Larinioides sclopetarius]|uniref:Elongin-A n=1 Tax=Larinioides sclopetarius TaxID=280406 RepID=A0AAV2B8J1_9ARAC
MERCNDDHLNSFIIWCKQKIESNKNCTDMNESTQDYIEQLGELPIPPKTILEKELINYMKSVAHRFTKFKKDADIVTRKWQQQVRLFLRKDLPEKHYLERVDRNRRAMDKMIQSVSPRINGTWKTTRINGTWNTNQRNSGSDDRQNYHSSSSQEVESPDSQTANERSTSINHRSNHDNHSFVRKSSSPLQLEHPVSQNLHPAEFNANLSIDHKEVTPINKVQGSPVKPDDRFSIAMTENMFKAVKLKEPIKEENLSMLFSICKDMLYLPLNRYPHYVKMYGERLNSSDQIIKVNSDSSDCTKSLNGKTEKNKDSTHMPKIVHNSHNMPSTSQQGARESSKGCLESKHDKRRRHMESSQSAVKAKESKEEQQPPQDSKNLLSMSQQGAVESSKSCSGSKHDKKRRHMEGAQPVVKSKELKLEKQPTQDSKNLPSMSQHGGTESSKTCLVSKHDRKRNHMEISQSVVKTKELKEEQQPSQYSKLKHISRTEHVVKSRESKEEQQHAQGRTLKGKEIAQSVAKAYEFKEYQPAQDSKLKLDSKRALEARNCDKNHIKKRDSPDQSALIAITSSKKERMSLYHGGRKPVLRLQDICIRTLIKAIKQTSDPTKYINRNVTFKILEPVLVLISPEKLHKLEEEMMYLKDDTDGVWRLCCERNFKSMFHLKTKDENWRTFYQRCRMECEERLRNVTASVSASVSKAKPDRQIKFTTVDGPPTKRQKPDYAMIAKSNANNSAIKPLPNSSHPSNSRSDVPVPLKGISNHIKPSHKIIKKDAPLMHKAKKTLGQLHRIHRN